MTFLIAAAGTGGHVFPGLSVAEALIDLDVQRSEILFVGGARLESKVYPEEGFPFLQVELRGLQRSLTVKNLTLPGVVLKARNRIQKAIAELGVRTVLGMGGYVTIPAGMAASRAKVPFFNSEQNAEAGLANRVAARWALKSFGSFPETAGLRGADWVGNPVREPFWSFQRPKRRPEALHRYGLSDDLPVLGVFGGSLGAGAINDAVAGLATTWSGRPMQILHLTGEQHLESLSGLTPSPEVEWKRVAFEDSMEMFYAVSDLVIARAGGAVAELTATSTPSILIPGDFGSSGHQAGNAEFLTRSGAAVSITQKNLDTLPQVVDARLFDVGALDRMRDSAARIAKPNAARTIAKAMLEAR